MPVEIVAEIESTAGHRPLIKGWRGLAAFEERWSEADEELRHPPDAPLPIGEPLTYGCELQGDASDGPVTLRLWYGDTPRPVMTPGARFTLRDGPNIVRATASVLSARGYT